MAKLIFPVLSDGLLVDIMIGLDAATTVAQVASGQLITTPVLSRAEIDTGTNITAVSAAILGKLGVPALFQTTTQTAAGPLTVDVFKVSVGIRNLADPTAPSLVEGRLLVMKLLTSLPLIEALIGLDLLLGCKLVLDGPARQFSLEF